MSTKRRPMHQRSDQAERDQADLDRAYDVLDRHTPDWTSGLIRWLRSPGSRWVRLPLGLLFIGASVLWFLPVLGIEMLPIGLLLVAQDIPLVRGYAARMVLWLELQALRLLRRWRAWRRSGNATARASSG